MSWVFKRVPRLCWVFEGVAFRDLSCVLDPQTRRSNAWIFVWGLRTYIYTHTYTHTHTHTDIHIHMMIHMYIYI